MVKKISMNICKRTISKEVAKEILKNNISPNINGFVSKNNKLFNAKLKLEEDGNLSFVFN